MFRRAIHKRRRLLRRSSYGESNSNLRNSFALRSKGRAREGEDAAAQSALAIASAAASVRGLMRAAPHVESEVSGWGRFPVARSRVVCLDDWRTAGAVSGPRIARGAGRSYGDASFASGGMTLDVCPRDRFLEFDAATGRLSSEAGVTLADVLGVIVPAGWFLPVTPGTKRVTLGGCVAADVHGKNHPGAGSFARTVVALEMVLADGREVRCSATEWPELFWATCGGMGLTGLIRTVTLQLERIASPLLDVQTFACRDLDETLARFSETDCHLVAWLDCLSAGRRALVTRARIAPESAETPAARKDQPRRVPCDAPSWLLNPASVRLYNAVHFHRERRHSTPVRQTIDEFFYPLDRLDDWNRLYGRRGFIQYQFAVPRETAREAIETALDELPRAGQHIFLAVLKALGAEAGPLSFPRPGFTLALDLPMTGAPLLVALDVLDERIAALGGRVYLAKDARMSAKWMPSMYPRLGEWLAVKRAVDPQNLFQSDLARRLGLLA